jgi:DNA-binding response OmpR family regulator
MFRSSTSGGAGTLHADKRRVALDAGQSTRVPPQQADTASPRRFCVLVAEDDREMNAVLTEALVADGHEVVPVETGTDALARFFGNLGSVPDAAVMDVRMPGLSGLQVLAALRKNGAAVAVIIITAFGEDALHREAYSLGAVHVFDKPFDVDELRAAVRELSRKGQREARS